MPEKQHEPLQDRVAEWKEKQDGEPGDRPHSDLGLTVDQTIAITDELGSRFSQRGVKYRNASDSERACATCRFFVRDYENKRSSLGGCQVVDGPIWAFGDCDSYISAAEEAEAIIETAAASEPEPVMLAEDTDVETEEYHKEFSFAKIDDEHPDYTFVLGPVLVPETFDKQGDIVSAEEIENAAHEFVQMRGPAGFMHKLNLDPSKATVVESYVTRAPQSIGGKRIKKGTWMIGMRVFNDMLRQKIREGKLGGFSIGGRALAA